MTVLYGVDIDASVAQGVELLHERLPGWWREDHVHPIDLEVLDVRSGSACVTAQLSGEADWVDGMEMLDLSHAEYVWCGFRVRSHGEMESVPERYNEAELYDAFTKKWREVIADLRAGEVGG
jgi:hypothetical protein